MDIPGATNPTLTLGPVATDDDGASFDVVVSNPGGFDISTPVRLVVVPPVANRAIVVAGVPGGAAADKWVVNRLAALGFTVTVIDDDLLTPTAVQGAQVVVVSSSVVPSKVGTTLTGVAIPLVTWEAYLVKPLGLASSGAETAPATQIRIGNVGHPVAAGRNGVVAVHSTATALTRATGLAPGVQSVGSDVAGGGATLFVASAGAPLLGGMSARAKRAVLPWTYNSPTVATSSSWAIFDATIRWATS